MLIKSDIRYIIKRVIIGVLIAIILSFISGYANADSVCIQAQWLGADVRLSSGETNTPYTYGRFMGQCGSKVKIQIPIMFSTINTVPFQTSSSIFRIDLTNGETYYGELKNGFIEFNNVRVNGNPAVSNLYVRYSQESANDWILVSKYLQVFSIEDTSTINTNINNVNNSVNNVNNSINDNTPVSNNDVSGNASDWASNNTDSPVINQLVLMPVTLLNAFVNGLSNTCSTYSFGTLFDTELTLPCINLSQKLGVVWTTIDVILSGVFIFIFGKRCVKIFNDFTNLRSGQIDSLYGGDN